MRSYDTIGSVPYEFSAKGKENGGNERIKKKDGEECTKWKIKENGYAQFLLTLEWFKKRN